MSLACEIEQEVKYETFRSVETYAHSLSTLKKLGSVALGEISDLEQRAAIDQLAFDDFSTAIAEMLKTDEELGDVLEVNNNREHEVIDGRVRARDGKAMVDVLTNGLDSSTEMSQKDPRYKGQMVRDTCDVVVAKRVDQLKPGETLWGVSFAAQKDLEDYPEIYDKKFGYKRNLVYVQTYSMESGVLKTGSYSFEVTNKAAFMELIAEHEMDIPEDESDNTWLLHSVVAQMSSEEAENLVIALRREYYKRVGREVVAPQSVSHYMDCSHKTLRHFFNTYYPDLGKAVKTNTNNDTLRSFAKSLLESGADLKPEIVRQLLRIRNSQKFTAEDGSMTDSIIRYAVAEEMRKGLHKTQNVSDTTAEVTVVIQPYVVPIAIHANSVNALFAQNVRDGIVAKRSYGGCPGNIELGKKNDGLNQDGLAGNGLQEAYGGKDVEENREVSDSKEGKIRCFKCREIVNKREVVKEKTWCCPKCKYEVDICTGDVKNQGEKPQEADDSPPEQGESIFARILSEVS